MKKEKKKGLKKDLKVKVTEFVEIPDDVKFTEVHQELLYTYPKGYVPDEFEPEPMSIESWAKLFKYDTPLNRKTLTVDDVRKELNKPIRGSSPDILIEDEKDFIVREDEEEPHKVYKFEVIFVNLGDDYGDDPKEELQHFIEEGLNRWNSMNASVMISDVRERIIDWQSEETQKIYNMNDSTFEDWNKIFAQEDFFMSRSFKAPDFKKRVEQMRKEWDLDE